MALWHHVEVCILPSEVAYPLLIAGFVCVLCLFGPSADQVGQLQASSSAVLPSAGADAARRGAVPPPPLPIRDRERVPLDHYFLVDNSKILAVGSGDN